MVGKFGVLLLALLAVFAVSRFLAAQGRRSGVAHRRKAAGDAKTLVKDPKTGRYRAQDDHDNGKT